MKYTLILILSLIIPFVASAQDPIDQVMSRAESGMKKIMGRANKAQEKIMEDYEKKQKAIMDEYEKHCLKLMRKWGDQEVVESTRKDWVEYSKDESSRSIVDFKNGKVTVEILTDPSENEDNINLKLEKALEDLFASKGKTPGFNSEILPQEDVSDKPILEGQIDLSKYNDKPAPDNNGKDNSSSDITKSIVQEEKKEKRVVDTENGRKEITSIHLELVEDHIPKRAEEFKDEIRKHSRRLGVNEPLIYAIMEQESYFNPMARSSKNAYGLMQIVPSSGGLDANRYIHNIDKKPLPADLYKPDYNIELGTGYLKKQMEVYFKDVTDPRCRMLCAIAAYNTGQGNVYYVFTGKRRPEGAAKEINKHSFNSLYEHLCKKLTHSETRNYVKMVVSKMDKYTKQ